MVNSRIVISIAVGACILAALFVFFSPPPAEAQFGINFIDAILRVAGYIRNIWNAGNAIYGIGIPENVPHVFPFGGRITSTGGGCHIRFWIWYTGPPLFTPIPCPNCGFIPLSSYAVTVGQPVPGYGEMFSFPLITDTYANYHQGQVGVWTLGLGFTPFPIDRINSALGAIPRIPYGAGWFDRFSLRCSNDNLNVILKIGTS